MSSHLSPYYKLDAQGQPVACDFDDYQQWFQHADRRVAFDLHGVVEVSTVFIGLNFALSKREPPRMFESRIFGGPHDGEKRRYDTREQALAGHAELVAMIRKPVPRPTERPR